MNEDKELDALPQPAELGDTGSRWYELRKTVRGWLIEQGLENPRPEQVQTIIRIVRGWRPA